MQSGSKRGTENLLIGICVSLICFTGWVLFTQQKGKAIQDGNTQNPIGIHSKQNKNQSVNKNTSTQANTFLKAVRENLKQPRDFPFHPKWSGDVYNPDREVVKEYQEALKKHVLLRQFYTSSLRFSPEFLKMSNLLDDWNADHDTIQCLQLFDALRMLESVNESLDSDPKLTPPQSTKGLEKISQRRKLTFSNWINDTFGIDDPKFLESLMMIRPKEGFGVPDTRIEPFEPLLEK